MPEVKRIEDVVLRHTRRGTDAEAHTRARARAAAQSITGGAHVNGSTPPHPSSGIGLFDAADSHTLWSSIRSEPGMKKLPKRAMRCHPFRRTSGVSTTFSRGSSRAW